MYNFNLLDIYFDKQKGEFKSFELWFFNIMVNGKQFCILNYQKDVGYGIRVKITTRILTICNLKIVHKTSLKNNTVKRKTNGIYNW